MEYAAVTVLVYEITDQGFWSVLMLWCSHEIGAGNHTNRLLPVHNQITILSRIFVAEDIVQRQTYTILQYRYIYTCTIKRLVLPKVIFQHYFTSNLRKPFTEKLSLEVNLSTVLRLIRITPLNFLSFPQYREIYQNHCVVIIHLLKILWGGD